MIKEKLSSIDFVRLVVSIDSEIIFLDRYMKPRQNAEQLETEIPKEKELSNGLLILITITRECKCVRIDF